MYSEPINDDIYNEPNIEITTYIGCPLMCNYCPQDALLAGYKGDNHKGKKVMELDSFKSMLAKIPKEVQILFSGYVEPWTNPACTDMVVHTLEQGYRVSIFTTLQGMTEDDADRTLDIIRKRYNQMNIINIHLPDKDMFMRGWKNTPVYFNVLDKFFRFYNEKGGIRYPKLQAMTMDLNGEPHSSIVERYGLMLSRFEGIDRAGSLNTERNKVDEAVMAPKVKNNFKNGCSATPSSYYNHQVLLPNGDVQLCCMDFGIKNKLGNLNEIERWEDIFSTPEYKRVEELSNMVEYTDELICKSCDQACRI
jgi:hypothetical protein